VRYPADEGKRILRTAMGPEGARNSEEAVADRIRGEREHADAVRQWRSGRTRANRRGGADVHGAAETTRACADGALSRHVPRRLEPVEHGSPLLRRVEVVAAVPGFAKIHEQRAALIAVVRRPCGANTKDTKETKERRV